MGYLDSHSNWGRWGWDDEPGTLNFITPHIIGSSPRRHAHSGGGHRLASRHARPVTSSPIAIGPKRPTT
jgi:hypothetical protein